MTGPTIMRGTPPPPDDRVTLNNWDKPPFNRWSFQHVSEILPTVRVHRGRGPRSVLPETPAPLDDLKFKDTSGVSHTVAEWMEEDFTDGFLVLHRGHIVYERYFNGMDEATLHLSQSVAKSVICAVAGALTSQRLIDPDTPLEVFFPELASSGYAGATLRHAMDMQSGVSFVEDYADPDCDVSMIDRVAGWKPHRHGDPETMLDLVLRLKQTRPHGEKWEYRSIETDVVAMCLERATGERLANLVSRLIWDQLGAEEDANFTVDRAGYALGCGGFNATLRDYARFGEMLTRGGQFNGRQIVPAEFVAECRRGDGSKFSGQATVVLPNGAYRNGFWVEDTATGVLLCRGIYGQLIYSDPRSALTVVRLASWPEATSDQRSGDGLRLIHAIKVALTTAA